MDVATLRAAMTPTSVADTTLAEYLPHFVAAMDAAEINTVNRSAAWCSQIGHESGGLRYMAEIQTSDPSWSADRTRYRGRGPIQLTWESNYRKFGQWCAAQGYVNDPELFVAQPKLVEQPRWGFLAASWYWLNGGPRPGRINEYADARDILAVSRCVNGWVEGRNPNGYADRCQRWNGCLALGDQLLTGGAVPAVMTGDPVWLEDVLRADLGARLVVEDGWAERGVGGSMGDIWGVMIHHTANRNETVAAIRDGVDQGPPNGFLPGPLSQCLIKPDGTCHLVAVGPCNHAGPRDNGGMGPINGNQRLIGFECAYDGTGPWPQKQIITMRDATAAVLRRLGHRGDRCIGHKEYAPSRKVDPGNMSMPWFRDEVNKDLDGFVFPGESVISVPPVPDYDKESWDQLRIEWPQLGNQTLVNANAEMRDKVCGKTDYADWKAGKP